MQYNRQTSEETSNLSRDLDENVEGDYYVGFKEQAGSKYLDRPRKRQKKSIYIKSKGLKCKRSRKDNRLVDNALEYAKVEAKRCDSPPKLEVLLNNPSELSFLDRDSKTPESRNLDSTFKNEKREGCNTLPKSLSIFSEDTIQTVINDCIIEKKVSTDKCSEGARTVSFIWRLCFELRLQWRYDFNSVSPS